MIKTIVVDTSVFISALIGVRGPSREVIRRCLNGSYNPLISNALFQELEDV
ncbi:MAG TPA: PIN domain-containing protein, partial [Gammaproteobacteria bacterium]|nr:PIN domain-containing protein [Gammaproteobacteria bacterium]